MKIRSTLPWATRWLNDSCRFTQLPPRGSGLTAECTGLSAACDVKASSNASGRVVDFIETRIVAVICHPVEHKDVAGNRPPTVERVGLDAVSL